MTIFQTQFLLITGIKEKMTIYRTQLSRSRHLKITRSPMNKKLSMQNLLNIELLLNTKTERLKSSESAKKRTEARENGGY